MQIANVKAMNNFIDSPKLDEVTSNDDQTNIDDAEGATGRVIE